MTLEEIKKLLYTLDPQCDEETFDKVVSIFRTNISPRVIARTDQQRVDVYDSGLANDPLKW